MAMLGAGLVPADAAPFALIGNALDNSVSVIDVASPTTPTATIAISGTPSGIATNPLRREGYVAVVTDEGVSALSVIDTNGFAEVAVIPLTVVDPTGVAVNSAGTRAYVTGGFTDNLVSVVNLDTRTEIKTIPVGNPATAAGPIGIVVHPAQPLVYVANSNTGKIAVINTSTNAVTAINLAPCPTGCVPL